MQSHGRTGIGGTKSIFLRTFQSCFVKLLGGRNLFCPGKVSASRGQSALEYVLLAAVAIVALLVANVVLSAKNGALGSHFLLIASHLGANIF